MLVLLVLIKIDRNNIWFQNSTIGLCFMQAFLNCHGVTQICAHFFTMKVNLGYEAF